MSGSVAAGEAAGVDIGGLVIALPGWTAYAAVAVAGLTGATYAAKRGFDVVGVFGLSIATGLGGLLLRDILLANGTPVVLTDPTYILVAALVAIIGFLFAGLIAQFTAIIVILEGLAIGFLGTSGAISTISDRLSFSTAILIGVITAVGGGILRDVLSGTAPAIVRPGSFMAITAILATGSFVLLLYLDVSWAAAQLVAMLVALGANSGSHWFGWHTGAASDLSDRVWDFWGRGLNKVDRSVSKSVELIKPGAKEGD